MACVYAMMGISSVNAAEYINSYVPEPRLVGQGRAQVLLWDVYDAKLYAPSGVYAENKPFALELSYLQELEARQIADHAVREIRRMGYNNESKLTEWHGQMIQILPDVIPSSIITGVSTPNGPTIFYADGEVIGRINDPEFGRHFFRIWLDVRTSTPSLRENLLNKNTATKGYPNETPVKNSSSGGNYGS